MGKKTCGGKAFLFESIKPTKIIEGPEFSRVFWDEYETEETELPEDPINLSMGAKVESSECVICGAPVCNHLAPKTEMGMWVPKHRKEQSRFFKIVSNPEIPLTQIRDRRLNIIFSQQFPGVAEIRAEEDERVLDALSALCQETENPIPDISDLVSKMGSIWGTKPAKAPSNITFQIPPEPVEPRSEPDDRTDAAPKQLGTPPVPADPPVCIADNSKALIGFSIFEDLGVGFYNPHGLVRLTVTRGGPSDELTKKIDLTGLDPYIAGPLIDDKGEGYPHELQERDYP